MHVGFMHSRPSMHGYPPWVTTHWKSDPHFRCIWMGRGMPLVLFIMCLAWVAACSLGFERGDSCTWGFRAQVSAHAWLSSTNYYTFEVCHTFQMDLYAQIACHKVCLPYVNIYWLSFNRADSHACGFHQLLSGHAWLAPMSNHTLEIRSTVHMHLDELGHASWVDYRVFCMSCLLFIWFRKGGQRPMGVPCRGVHQRMALPHKKLHIGSLSHLSNKSVCIDGVPLGLSNVCLASVDICLLGFNSADSRTRRLHAQVSGHAWLSPIGNHTLEVWPAFHVHLDG